jgi:alkylation response protein AidB-like acyl-CoA dehydrogenase
MSVPGVSLDEFRSEAREFLDAHAQPRRHGAFEWGVGEDTIGFLDARAREDERALLDAARTWRATKFDAGFGWITGPVEYGGRALPSVYDVAWRALEASYAVPGDMFGIGTGMVGPTIAGHGTEATRGYVRQIFRGDLIACQLFSEPAAGSDLASVRMRADRDGDEWVLNGQKVWTSSAHHADIGEALARTDWDLPKHKGITAFIVDMKAPGVSVRPLRQINGNENFNEVFFTDVRVPDDHRLGAVNDGWRVAVTTLNNERASIGAGRNVEHLLDRLVETARRFGRLDDPVVRDRLARVISDFRIAEFSNQRAMDKIVAGRPPGPELAMAKQANVRNLSAAAALAADLLGPRIVARTDEWGTWPWANFLLSVPGQRIGGGTDEVMRTVVAERVLGLPKEPSIDRDRSFKDLPTGGTRS